MPDSQRQQVWELQYAQPTIKIFYCESRHTDYTPVLSGIEEEGIPWEISPLQAEEAAALAYAASSESRLGVGVGVGASSVALHFEKLSEGQPLFLLPAEAGEQQLRALGANAARLVKKLPFKPL